MEYSSAAHVLHVKTGPMEAFPVLIADGNRLLLVDAGFPGQFAALAEEMRKAGYEPQQLTHLFFTHQDLDHIGGAKDLRAVAPEMKAMALDVEAPYIDGRKPLVKVAAREAQLPQMTEEEKQDFLKFKMATTVLRIPIDMPVKDGDMLDFAGGIEVIATPGHTPGHACLLLRREGLLLAGDALRLVDGQLAGPNPAHTQDLAQARRSLAKLAGKGIRRVACYHGGLFTGDFEAALPPLMKNTD